MADIPSLFADAIRRHGLREPSSIIADGEIHRFRSGDEKSENGFYRLVVLPAHGGGEIGFGTIGCWKRGVKAKWSSREPGQIHQADREAMERKRAELKKKEQEAAAKALEKARSLWASLKPADPKHRYLVAKAIQPRGIRQYKDSLVVPVTRGGEVTSLQFIGPDGGKKFLTGGKVEGGYAGIAAKGDSRDRIVICEGYATGASLYAALGVPVVVAFNAGNLLPVARAIRQKYQDAALILACDNDQWTKKPDGTPYNPGVELGQRAADAVGGKAVWPPFDADDPMKPTDWNDFHARFGLQRTRGAFEALLSAQPEPPDPPPPEAPPWEPAPEDVEAYAMNAAPAPAAGFADWRARLIPGKVVAAGYPFPFDAKSKINAYLFLKHHERFDGVLCYNEFTDQVMLVRCPPWESPAGFVPRRLRDDDFFMLAAHLEYCDVSVGLDTAAAAAVKVARENTINPPREYFERLSWDGTPRLDKWLAYYLGADEQPAEYLALVGAKWLVGAVSRVFRPGCKFDSVLILEGSQGVGKSMALRTLATFGDQDFFLDSVGDIRSKDTLMTMQGKLIVEIAELASFKKTENEEIKAFITRQVDEYRPPWGRTVTRRPRYFVLAGSTNELDEGYLTDDTGNRRYWPVKCKAIDVAALGRDRDQLWAEAVVRHRNGERTWLADDEARNAAAEQKSRFLEDAWQERIADILLAKSEIRVDDICNKLELKPRDINNMTKKRIKNSLRQLGWYETRRAGEGRVWRPGDRVPRDLFGGAAA